MTNISNILASTSPPHLTYPSRVSEHEPEAEDDKHSDAKMSLDTSQAGRLISRNGATWRDNNRSGKTTIYYEFDLKDPVNQGDTHTNFTHSQKEGIRKSMLGWSDIANITYKENPPEGEWLGDKKFFRDNPDAEGVLTIRKTPSMGIGGSSDKGGGNVWFSLRDPNLSFSPKSLGNSLATHELGHNLGLDHPGPYNGAGSTYENDAIYAEDTHGHSVMSYFDDTKNGPKHHGVPSWTPMMDDISAVQRLYGANYNTRNTDTTYGFNSNTGRESLTFESADDRPVLCIWDGGGNDTLDCSGYKQDQHINLNEQTFSNVGGLKGNVSIAKGVTLENAVGGPGDDHIIGNDADNRLTGGVGTDRLSGGKGKNTFVYHAASDSTPEKPDLITDFISGKDSIDVSTLLKKNGMHDLHFVTRFSGKAGEAVLGFNEKSNEGTLMIDLKGSGQAGFLVKSHGQIYPSDVLRTPAMHKAVDTSPARINPDGGRIDGYVPPAPIVLPPVVRVVTGTQENDELRGDHGDNQITGASGADILWGGAGKNTFVYEDANDSTVKRPDQIVDFKTGVDTIDVSKALKKAGLDQLNFVSQFTGRPGDTIISHNPTSNESSIGIDMTGNKKADLFIYANGQIKSGDVLTDTH